MCSFLFVRVVSQILSRKEKTITNHAEWPEPNHIHWYRWFCITSFCFSHNFFHKFYYLSIKFMKMNISSIKWMAIYATPQWGNVLFVWMMPMLGNSSFWFFAASGEKTTKESIWRRPNRNLLFKIAHIIRFFSSSVYILFSSFSAIMLIAMKL